MNEDASPLNSSPEESSSGRCARKPKGEGHERRGEILEAAERVFVELGYEGATIRRIATEVGLSSTALYMHFPDKAAILQEICRKAFDDLLQGALTIRQASTSPAHGLRRMVEAYVDFGFSNPNAYRLAYMTLPVEARAGAESAAQSIGADLYQVFVDMVRDIGPERLRAEPEIVARTIWAGAHGVTSLVIAKPYLDWSGKDQLVETMLDSLFTALIEV